LLLLLPSSPLVLVGLSKLSVLLLPLLRFQFWEGNVFVIIVVVVVVVVAAAVSVVVVVGIVIIIIKYRFCLR
jgi:hypothetical protein